MQDSGIALVKKCSLAIGKIQHMDAILKSLTNTDSLNLLFICGDGRHRRRPGSGIRRSKEAPQERGIDRPSVH